MTCVRGQGHFGVFAFCTRQMSAPPPVARRQSGIRVMLTQGEQPLPSLPIYPNSAKGTNTQTFCHVSLPVRHSRLILIFLNTLFPPSTSPDPRWLREWFQRGGKLRICAERSGMWVHKWLRYSSLQSET